MYETEKQKIHGLKKKDKGGRNNKMKEYGERGNHTSAKIHIKKKKPKAKKKKV